MATATNGSGSGPSGSSFGNCNRSYSHSVGSNFGCPSADKVYLLEAQLSSLRQQMSVLAVEMGLAYEWIRNTFGVQIINVDSPHYKSVHVPSFEMQAIQKSLEVTGTNVLVTRTSHAQEAAGTLSISNGDKERRTRKADSRSSANTAAKKTQIGVTSHGQSAAPAKVVVASPVSSPASGSASTLTNTSSGAIRQTRPGKKKQFKCVYCPQSFSRQFVRSQHERIHSGEKPYRCRFCNNSFSQLGTRITHERGRHTGEKPYKCGIAECPKSFTSATHKKRHERSHTGEKPFECEYCDKKFRQSTSLVIHVRTHTGEKPYSCGHPNCGQTFYSSSALGSHKHRTYPGSN